MNAPVTYMTPAEEILADAEEVLNELSDALVDEPMTALSANGQIYIEDDLLEMIEASGSARDDIQAGRGDIVRFYADDYSVEAFRDLVDVLSEADRIAIKWADDGEHLEAA